jgi:hypothetical protein
MGATHIDITYLPNQLSIRTDFIMREFKKTQLDISDFEAPNWTARDLRVERSADTRMLYTHQYLLKLIEEKGLAIPVEAILADVTVKEEVKAVVKAYQINLQALQALREVAIPQQVERIKIAMERVIHSLIELNKKGFDLIRGRQ